MSAGLRQDLPVSVSAFGQAPTFANRRHKSRTKQIRMLDKES